jgi:predicted small lipoprotein YifL
MKTTKLLLSILALTSITACGLSGPLERPDPIWDGNNTPAPQPAPAEPPVQSIPENDVPDDELLGGPL